MKRMTTALILATCCTALMGCMPETATGMQHQALPSTAPYLSLIVPKCAKDKTKNLEILKEAENRAVHQSRGTTFDAVHKIRQRNQHIGRPIPLFCP